jgi:hypothetical protein
MVLQNVSSRWLYKIYRADGSVARSL